MITFQDPREATQDYVRRLRSSGYTLSNEQTAQIEDHMEAMFEELKREIAAAYIRREATRQLGGPLRNLERTLGRISKRLSERARHA